MFNWYLFWFRSKTLAVYLWIVLYVHRYKVRSLKNLPIETNSTLIFVSTVFRMSLFNVCVCVIYTHTHTSKGTF